MFEMAQDASFLSYNLVIGLFIHLRIIDIYVFLQQC